MKSILSKLGLAVTSLVILILLLVWVFQIIFLNRFYINERKNDLINEGERLSKIIIETEEDKNLIDELEKVTSDLNAKIDIVDSSGDIKLSRGNIPRIGRVVEGTIRQKEIINLLSGETVILQSTHHRFGTSFLVVGVPVDAGDRIVGGVILSISLAPVKETTSILKKQLSIISIVSIIIATLLAFLLAKIFTRPILKITEMANEIAKGKFNTGVSIKSKDEIGILGERINFLSEQLAQVENFRREFIANISHELKTPLSLIRAYAEMIVDIHENDTEERKKNVGIILEETGRLNKMVEDILYLSKMEAGNSELNKEAFFVTQLLEDIIRKLRLLADKRNILLELHVDAPSINIRADKDKMEQVFINLINNAIQHCTDNGKVIVKVFNLNEGVRIEFIDNGEGIPEEDLPYVWDRFYKVNKSRKRDSSGTGLGMPIVKNILEIHNFNYGIKSKLNEGTIIWIEVPMHCGIKH